MDKAALKASPVPPILPFSNNISAIDAGCPPAALLSRKALITRHGTPYRETKALDMIPIVIGGAFSVGPS
jgi:hypothetical protein